MDYFLTDEQKEIQALARQIAEERVLPVRAELDEKEEFPWDIVHELARSDMFRVFVPEAYEGLGGGTLELCLVTEELARVCSGVKPISTSVVIFSNRTGRSTWIIFWRATGS